MQLCKITLAGYLQSEFRIAHTNAAAFTASRND
jgi:hypothetical protein